MEQVIDKIISEVTIFSETDSVDGGCRDILELQGIYFGDPGIIPVSLYPCVTIEPQGDTPIQMTTGYETRELQITVSVHLDAREFYDADVDEASGDRALVRTMFLLQRWFQTTSNRRLDGDVLNLDVRQTEYGRTRRDDVVTKSARQTLVVRKNYARVP